MKFEKQLTPFELQELVNTFYQPLVFKVDTTSQLGTTVVPPNFNRSMELMLEVGEKQFKQCLDGMDKPGNNTSEITFRYKNMDDIHCICIVTESSYKQDVTDRSKFWITVVVISVPEELTLQGSTWRSDQIYEEITEIKHGGIIERSRKKL